MDIQKIMTAATNTAAETATANNANNTWMFLKMAEQLAVIIAALFF